MTWNVAVSHIVSPGSRSHWMVQMTEWPQILWPFYCVSSKEWCEANHLHPCLKSTNRDFSVDFEKCNEVFDNINYKWLQSVDQAFCESCTCVEQCMAYKNDNSLSELFPLDGFRYNFVSALLLNTLWYISMTLYSYLEQVPTMCRIREWQFLLAYFLSYFFLIVY